MGKGGQACYEGLLPRTQCRRCTLPQLAPPMLGLATQAGEPCFQEAIRWHTTTTTLIDGPPLPPLPPVGDEGGASAAAAASMISLTCAGVRKGKKLYGV